MIIDSSHLKKQILILHCQSQNLYKTELDLFILRCDYLVTGFLTMAAPWGRLCDRGDDPRWGRDPGPGGADQVPGARRVRDLHWGT